MATKLKGILVPFQMSDASYPVAAVGSRVLASSMLSILSTTPGERVYRPDFGSWLRRILFANMRELATIQARSEVLRALAQWEPRITLLGMTFSRQETTIQVFITWQPTGSQNVEQTTLTFGG